MLAGCSECLIAAAAVLAQASLPPEPVAATVGEVVVTARRREENAQDVPVALSVIGAAALDRAGAYNVAGLTQLAPAVQLLSSNPRNTAVTIRGLGASYGLANDGLEGGVGVYIDGVYNARPASATLDFVDVERVEVLRGPQGTLFGKNTTAGALNITTRSPTFEPEGQAELSVGGYGFLQAKATAAGPLIADRLAGRLSVVSTDRDGLLNNVVTGRRQNDQNSLGVRGQLLWTPSAALDVRVYADWNRQETECCTQVYVTYGPTLKPAAQQFPALAAGRGYRPASLDPFDRLADVDDDIQADQTHAGASAVVDYDLGWATLTSVSAYRKWEWDPANDRDYTSLDIIRRSANPSEQDQASQELRLASNSTRRVDWVAGVFFFDQTVTTTGVTEYGSDASHWLLPAGTPDALMDGYTVFNDSGISTESWAVFGQLTWSLTPRLKLTPGLRYTDESKTGSYRAAVAGGLETTDAALLSRRLAIARPQFYRAEISDGSLSGQASLSYAVTADVLAYASYARGYKSGGINMAGIPNLPSGEPALTSAAVAPETVTTYELGLKTQLWERRVTANLAVYSTEIEDYQANVVDSGPGALRGYLANIERVEVRGAELDVSARPFEGVSAYYNLAWTDGSYASFRNGPCPLELIAAATTACDLTGRALPGVSRWAGSAGAEHRRPATLAGISGDIHVGADASFRSAYVSDASASRYARIPAYEIVNLRAGFRADDGWEVFAFARNALDEEYLQFVSVQSGNSGLVIGAPGDPRMVGVTVRVRR